MKDYNEVVEQRFDQQSGDKPSIYSADQPIGIYSRKIMFTALNRSIDFIREQLGDLQMLKLLDVGCGNGEMLDVMVKQGFQPNNAMGFDLSTNRIAYARQRYPSYHFDRADITQKLPTEEKFEVLSSFDLFSHLSTESQLLDGLRNVHKVLKDDGVFLWYDIASADHFSSPSGADTWGFNKSQMVQLAAQAGFKPIYYEPLFRNFFNRYHSVYQAGRVPHGLLRILEKVIPGRPGNHLFVFAKA